MSRFESQGIHTRLYYIIERSGDVDYKLRIEYLMKEYNLTQEQSEFVSPIKYNFEKLIKSNSIEEIMNLLENEIIDELKAKEASRIRVHNLMYNLRTMNRNSRLGMF